MLKTINKIGRRTRAVLSMTVISFDWVMLFRRKQELNSTNSTKTNTIQVTIHISRQVTYDTLGTDLGLIVSYQIMSSSNYDL